MRFTVLFEHFKIQELIEKIHGLIATSEDTEHVSSIKSVADSRTFSFETRSGDMLKVTCNLSSSIIEVVRNGNEHTINCDNSTDEVIIKKVMNFIYAIKESEMVDDNVIHNPYNPKELCEKFHLFAQASESVSKVSAIRKEDGDYVFDIKSTQPNDDMTSVLCYIVRVPHNRISGITVTTTINSKETFHSTIEIPDENNLNVILDNYLEACDLYNDAPVDDLVLQATKLHTVAQVKAVVANQDMRFKQSDIKLQNDIDGKIEDTNITTNKIYNNKLKYINKLK